MKTYAERETCAVLVGATGDFGTAITKRLLDAGLGVIAVARSTNSLQALTAAHPGVKPCAADISGDAAIAAIAAAIDKPVRMLVHGPGVAVAGGILTAPTESMVDAVNIKVGGLLRLVRATDAHLSTGSRIVANAAILNVVRQLSMAYGPRGITAHTIVPGPADTDRLRRVAATRAEQRGCSTDDVLDEMRAESSLGILSTPEQIAWAVSLLLAPEADAMTGSSLMLDAGRRRGLP